MREISKLLLEIFNYLQTGEFSLQFERYLTFLHYSVPTKCIVKIVVKNKYGIFVFNIKV